MAEKILHREGVAGFYRGFLPNALKNLPNKGAPRTLSAPSLVCLRPLSTAGAEIILCSFGCDSL